MIRQPSNYEFDALIQLSYTGKNGESGGICTHDLGVKSTLLCSLSYRPVNGARPEYRARHTILMGDRRSLDRLAKNGAPSGNRTRVSCLEDKCLNYSAMDALNIGVRSWCCPRHFYFADRAVRWFRNRTYGVTDETCTHNGQVHNLRLYLIELRPHLEPAAGVAPATLCLQNKRSTN